MVQRTPERLEISIVPETGFDAHAAFAFLRSVIHEYGDPKFDVRCATVNSIPRSASGKFTIALVHEGGQVNYGAAKVLALGLSFAWNFLSRKWLLFRPDVKRAMS